MDRTFVIKEKNIIEYGFLQKEKTTNKNIQNSQNKKDTCKKQNNIFYHFCQENTRL